MRDRKPLGILGYALAAGAFLVLSCDTPTDLTSPLLTTGGATYELVSRDNGLATSIDYVFENRTGVRLYITNCRGGYGYVLERREGEAWRTAYRPALFACLSPPIVIEPGEPFADTLLVWGAFPAESAWPKWDRQDPSGSFRLVLTGLSATIDGPDIELVLRSSNVFDLRRRNDL